MGVDVKFECLRCGKCCKLSSITVLPHEVLIIKKLARDLGVEVNFKPSYGVHDRLRGYFIVLSYTLELSNGKCPFLTSDNKCMLQALYKPLTCRAFPYLPKDVRYYFDDVSRIIVHRANYGISLNCTFVKENEEALSKALRIYGIRNVFPQEYNAAILMESLRHHYLLMLSKLWRIGLVDLRPGVRAGKEVNAYTFLTAVQTLYKSIMRFYTKDS